MATALVLGLFFLTLGLTAAVRRSAPRRGDSPPSPLADAARCAALALVAAAAVSWPAAPLTSPVLYQVRDLLRLDDSYARYQDLLCAAPRAVQGLLGLALLLGLGAATGLLFTAGCPRRWWGPACAAVAVWAGLYGCLPFHLSAPDFDDLFVVDKLLCSAAEHWNSNKPFFTAFDYLYRVADVVFPDDRFLRFRVNGWVFVLYEVNLLLLLRRFLGQAARQAFGPGGAALGAALALGSLGAVLLSHTLAYELAGSTCILAACNLIEHLRTGRPPRPSAPLLILAACGLGSALQFFSYPQYAAAWPAVCVHGALALHGLAAPRRHKLLAWTLAAAAAAYFLTAQKGAVLKSLDPSLWSPGVAAGLGLLLLAVLSTAAWLARCGTAAIIPRLTLLLYGVAALALTLLPNQGRTSPQASWVFAENYARYTTLSYPFVVLFLGWLACRLRRAARTRLFPGLLAAAAFYLWNAPYLRDFYFSPPHPAGIDAAGVFQRNMRPLLALDQALRDAGDVPLLYLPIPRDHSDLYLLRAARPRAAAVSVCAPGWRPGAAGLLALSRNTLFVSGEFSPQPPLRSYRGLEDKGWELQLFDTRDITPEAVSSWCRDLRAACERRGGCSIHPEELAPSP
ncbi:MAG: hypothetical protein HY926_10710 [Elusimicrobia bacterium]|nr:hypothetical protein [Elusimicrobiota bacterium]